MRCGIALGNHNSSGHIETYRWKVTEYEFPRVNKGNDEHFRLTGLMITSLKFILGEVEEL